MWPGHFQTQSGWVPWAQKYLWCPHRSWQSKAAMCRACLVISAPIVLTHLCIYWVLGTWQSHCSLDGCRSPPRESVNLLSSSISNVFSSEVPVFSFLVLKEWVSLLVLDTFLQRYSQPIIQKRKKWQNSLIRGRKGKETERGQWWSMSGTVKTRKTSKLFLAVCQIPSWLLHNSYLYLINNT